MPSFEELFKLSKGQPVEYKGETICMSDLVPLVNNQTINLIIESTSSAWRQGIHLSTEGTIVVNGQSLRGFAVLWQDTTPREVSIEIHSKKCELWVKNVWDFGDGVMQSWHNGAAMIVAQVGSVRRYRCNDGDPDDDFDDLIFSLHFATSTS